MADYTPPFTITNTMLDCVASISEKIGKIGRTKRNLRSKKCIRSICTDKRNQSV